MIQRKQSVYLLIAAIMMLLLFNFDLWKAEIFINQNENYSANLSITSLEYNESKGIEDEVKKEINPWWLWLLTLISATISLLTIFLYKNRLLQIKLSRINMLTITGLVVAIFLYIESTKKMFPVESVQGSHLVGIYLAIASVLFIYLAIKGIVHDEKLVRSADRIR